MGLFDALLITQFASVMRAYLSKGLVLCSER